MKQIFCCLLFLPFALPAQSFQLAPPQASLGLKETPFFSDSIVVDLHFDLPGAHIRYTLDGTSPGKEAPLFHRKMAVYQTCMLTAVAEHPDFLTSDPLRIQLVRTPAGFKPQQATLTIAPSEKYPGQGAATLHDQKKGHEDLSRGQWLGFEGKHLDYSMTFPEKIAASSLMVSVLSAPSSWIFPPQKIDLWAATGKKGLFRLVASLDIPPAREDEKGLSERLYFLNFKRVKAQRWRVVATNFGTLPDWHPGKGKAAWLFVDELGFVR